MRRTKPPVGWEHVKNCFPVPNELLEFDLPGGAIAVYIYLLRHADRKTRQCHPGTATIAKKLHYCRNTVANYVRLLEERGLIVTENTDIITKRGIKKNGNLLYTIVPMQVVTQAYYDRQFEKAELAAAQQNAKVKAEKLGISSSRRAMDRAHERPVFGPVGRCVRPDRAGWSPSPTEGILGGFAPLSGELAGTKEENPGAASGALGGHICPQCGQFAGFLGGRFLASVSGSLFTIGVCRPQTADGCRLFGGI